jgi:hypothetical protein
MYLLFKTSENIELWLEWDWLLWRIVLWGYVPSMDNMFLLNSVHWLICNGVSLGEDISRKHTYPINILILMKISLLFFTVKQLSMNVFEVFSFCMVLLFRVWKGYFLLPANLQYKKYL